VTSDIVHTLSAATREPAILGELDVVEQRYRAVPQVLDGASVQR
jgi:hypothetical protein